MKQCPQCNRTYDDSQAFCLMDGTPLLPAENETPTVVRQPQPQPSAPSKKSRLLLWLGLIFSVLLIGIVAGGFLIYKLSRQGENVTAKQSGKTSASPSPTLPPAPKTTPTPVSTPAGSPTVESSPKTELTKPTPNNDDAEDITPIGWDTSAVGFKGDAGQIYKFRCPPQGSAGTIWGSDIYTLDSSICTAAVHAGLFTLADGGVVTVEYRPGRSTYGSTERNGIKSTTYGEYRLSYVVR